MKNLTMKQAVNALIWSFLTLILVFMGTVLVGTIGRDEPLAPLSAEQQELVGDLQTEVTLPLAQQSTNLATLSPEQGDLYEKFTHVRKGDIVLDFTGTVIDLNTTVLLVTSENNTFGCNLKGIKTLATYKSFEELVRNNCRIIPYETEEWHRVMLNECTKPNFF
jgi:hypothetical protein